jgi:hypothetical protein
VNKIKVEFEDTSGKTEGTLESEMSEHETNIINGST